MPSLILFLFRFRMLHRRHCRRHHRPLSSRLHSPTHTATYTSTRFFSNLVPFDLYSIYFYPYLIYSTNLFLTIFDLFYYYYYHHHLSFGISFTITPMFLSLPTGSAVADRHPTIYDTFVTFPSMKTFALHSPKDFIPCMSCSTPQPVLIIITIMDIS